MDTPVGKPELWKNKPPADYKAGALRANWQTSLNQQASGILNKRDKSGKRAINQMKTMVSKYDGLGSVVFANNIDYASRIEYLGHSSQAPTGMVRVNVAAFQQAMDQAVKKVSP
jgi:hypothetical protein